MIRKYYMIVIICFSMLSNPMNPPIERKNWFLYLPIEINNLIASYLTFDDFETEEEFIERNRIPHLIPENLHKIITHKLQLEFGSKGGLIALCPNSASFIYLELTYDRIARLLLGIANITDNTLLIRHNIPAENYKKIALSSNAQLFATIHTKLITPLLFHYNLTALWEDKIIIRKTDSDKKQIITLNPLFKLANDHHTIAFNKQDTHLIIYGTDLEQNDYTNNVLSHKIIPITLARKDKPQERKTLQHYFEHKMICKEIKNHSVS